MADDPAGLRMLYVVLTRATQSLHVVYSEALPVPLAAAVADGDARVATGI